MSPNDKDRIEEFFSTIDPWINAYSNIGLSYFAVQKDDQKYLLLQARLFLNTASSSIPEMSVETASIVAGHFNFSDLGLSVREFVNSIVENGRYF